jgi:APA family basic amino acid/polyamine antiporter
VNKKPQQVGLLGAIAIGLASMLGAGVFVVFGSAYKIAGQWLFVALAIAGLVAAINSSSVFQLARQVDRPGGAYSYARVYRNDTLSFVAGFAFVFGKIGSIAAIALALGAYVSPDHKQIVAVLAILIMVVINSLGIQRTASVAAVLAAVTTAFLVSTSALGLANFSTAGNSELHLLQIQNPNIAMAASVLFFAFAGYARIATLGNEVRNAKRNIPLAIVLTISFVLALYAVLTVVLLAVLGDGLAGSATPFVQFFDELNLPLQSWVSAVAVFASLGSILALLAGVSRTAATMGEDHELPRVFEQRNRFGSPWLAEVIIAVGASSLVAIGSLAEVIGFSSFSVLIYYAIAHVSALGQPRSERVIPRLFAWIGAFLCIWLAISVPGPAAEISVAIIAVALLIRRFVR